MSAQPNSLFRRFRGSRTNAFDDGYIAALHRAQAVIAFDPDGTIVDANANFLAAFEYRLEDIVGRHHRIFVDADYAVSAAYATFWAELARGDFVSGEFERFTSAGRPLWLQATYNPVFDRDGRLVRVVKFATDITARKAADLEAKGQLDAIDRSMAIIEFDLDGKVLRANANFLAVMGYSSEEIVGRHHSLFVDAAMRGTADYQAFWARLRNGEFQTGQFHRQAKGGRDVWIEASYTPILDTRGRPYKVVKFATDVTTERQRTANYEGQIEAIHKVQAVIEFDLDGTVRSANDSFFDTVGYAPEQVLGQHHRMFVPAEERDSPAYAQFWSSLADGRANAGQFRRRHADGRDVWLQASYTPILDAAGRPYKVVKYCTSVTDQVEQTRALEALVRRIEDMASTIHGGSREIAAGNADLSSRTESQAAALEETAATMEQLASAIAQTAQNAEAAQRLTVRATDVAARGRSIIDGVVETMGLIQSASRKVAELLGVIDTITFQTNILALNAAVEAARAGDKGRGFAVVATEVRALAQRCAESAKEIKATLAESDSAVNAGTTRVAQAGTAMRDIGDAVQQTAAIVADIGTATREQTLGIQQVNTALQSMDDATQQNAALVEEIAASSSELEQAAGGLQDALAAFQRRA